MPNYNTLFNICFINGSTWRNIKLCKKIRCICFSPVILSICVIIFTLTFDHYIESTISISLSLIMAGILQVSFMFVCVKRADLNLPIIFNPSDPDVKKLLINMGPATISSGVQQLNLSYPNLLLALLKVLFLYYLMPTGYINFLYQ